MIVYTLMFSANFARGCGGIGGSIRDFLFASLDNEVIQKMKSTLKGEMLKEQHILSFKT